MGLICLPRLPAELFESTPSQDRSGAESSSYKPSDHLPLGEGILDLDAIIDALWPYAGHLPYWSLDFYACHDAERTGRESLQILREKVQRKM